MGWAGGAVPLAEPSLTLSAKAPKSRAMGRDPEQVLVLNPGVHAQEILGFALRKAEKHTPPPATSLPLM